MKLLAMLIGMGALIASPNRIINLTDLTEETVAEFCEGKLQDSVLECVAGSTLPFKVSFSGQFLAMDSETILPLTVVNTLYVKCLDEADFLFSTDLDTWQGFSEFFNGSVVAAINAEAKGPVAEIRVELNQRQ